VSSLHRDPHFASRVFPTMARAAAHHASSRLSGHASVSGRAPRGPARAAVARGARAAPKGSSAPNSIVFVSGNKGKVARLELALGLYCSSSEGTDPSSACDTVVRQVELDLPEIQADTVGEVALRKALDAFAVLKEPLVVHDCGLCVAALGDWPGPYTKNANDKLGTEGLLKLLHGVTDRRARWDDTIVYVDSHGDAKVFGPEACETREPLSSFPRNRSYSGQISLTPPLKWARFEGPERALGRVFVPTQFGLTECLADVSEEDYQRYRREAPSVWNEFARWWGQRGTEESAA